MTHHQLTPPINPAALPKPYPKNLPSLVPGSKTANITQHHTTRLPSLTQVGVRERYLNSLFRNNKNRTSATLSQGVLPSTTAFLDNRVNQSMHMPTMLRDLSPSNKRKSVKFAGPPVYGIHSVLEGESGPESGRREHDQPQIRRVLPPGRQGILKIPKLREADLSGGALWKACGRSLHFTTAFQSVMYEDTTLEGATRDRDKLGKTINRMREREAQKLERLELLQHKFEIAQQIEDECGVRLTEREIEKLSEITLSKMLKRRYIKSRNEQAAVLIQRRWKRYWARKLFIRSEERRQSSAVVIQKKWREYLQEVLYPRQERERKLRATLLLQRYIRGVQKKVKKDIEQVKLDFCFGYFERIRTGLLTNSQILIRYWWLKYKKRQQKKREEEERKKELKAQQKKKKSKYGVSSRAKAPAGPSSTLTRDTSKSSTSGLKGSKQPGLAATQPAGKSDQRSEIKTPGTRQESRASNEQLKSRGTDETKISSTGGGFNYYAGGGLDETGKSRGGTSVEEQDQYLMGHAGQRVPMEQVIDLEGTAPPGGETASPGGQPETIQEEKEEEVLPTGRAEHLEMEEGVEEQHYAGDMEQDSPKQGDRLLGGGEPDASVYEEAFQQLEE